jgi:hypothetical protein
LLGFLYSTPSYWPSLEREGLRERGERLHALAREGRWQDMPALVDDAMLDAFVPAAPYEEIPDVLASGWKGLCTALTFPLPEDPAEDPAVARAIARLRSG